MNTILALRNLQSDLKVHTTKCGPRLRLSLFIRFRTYPASTGALIKMVFIDGRIDNTTARWAGRAVPRVESR